MRKSDGRKPDRILKDSRIGPGWFVTRRVDLYNPLQDCDVLSTSERYRIA